MYKNVRWDFIGTKVGTCSLEGLKDGAIVLEVYIGYI